MPRGVYKRTGHDEARHKLQLLRSLQSEPIDFKIKYSLKVISMSLEKGAGIIFYSGGKDSTVLLHLIHSIAPGTPVMFNNTTLGTDNLLQHIRTFTAGMDYIETVPDLPPVEFWQKTGHFPILSKRGFFAYKKRIPDLKTQPVMCCYHNKEIPAMKVVKEKGINVLFWGNRADESNRRKWTFVDNGFLFQRKSKGKTPGNYYSYPLQHWTEHDIYSYLQKHLPGYPTEKIFEAGCLPCCTDIKFYPNNSSRLFLSNRNLWTYYMKSGFAEQIIKIKGFLPEKLDEIINNRPELLLKV